MFLIRFVNLNIKKIITGFWIWKKHRFFFSINFNGKCCGLCWLTFLRMGHFSLCDSFGFWCISHKLFATFVGSKYKCKTKSNIKLLFMESSKLFRNNFRLFSLFVCYFEISKTECWFWDHYLALLLSLSSPEASDSYLTSHKRSVACERNKSQCNFEQCFLFNFIIIIIDILGTIGSNVMPLANMTNQFEN